MKKSIHTFTEKKKKGTPIVMCTSYDYPCACLQEECGVDIQLVGDSVGTNVLGYRDIGDVTMSDMLHHTGAVARGAQSSFVLVDMPKGSYDTADNALDNARKMLSKGADGVKVEGEHLAETIQLLRDNDIAVCAHIGYTPQSLGPNARIQGKDDARIHELVTSAHRLENAGAFMIVLELVFEEVASLITRRLSIPTIGIGAGRFCDGQVQVLHDILGITPREFHHTRHFCDGRDIIRNALTEYIRQTRQGEFPGPGNVRHLNRQLPEDFARTAQHQHPDSL